MKKTFRAWNETKQAWLMKDFSIDGVFKSLDEWANQSGLDKGDEIHVDQCTGKEDKEKNKIYEMDLIKFDGGNIIYVICCDDTDGFYYKPYSVASKIRLPISDVMSAISQVVGNIHEGIDNRWYDLVKQIKETEVNHLKFMNS